MHKVDETLFWVKDLAEGVATLGDGCTLWIMEDLITAVFFFSLENIIFGAKYLKAIEIGVAVA